MVAQAAPRDIGQLTDRAPRSGCVGAREGTPSFGLLVVCLKVEIRVVPGGNIAAVLMKTRVVP